MSASGRRIFLFFRAPASELPFGVFRVGFGLYIFRDISINFRVSPVLLILRALYKGVNKAFPMSICLWIERWGCYVLKPVLPTEIWCKCTAIFESMEKLLFKSIVAHRFRRLAVFTLDAFLWTKNANKRRLVCDQGKNVGSRICIRTCCTFVIVSPDVARIIGNTFGYLLYASTRFK